MGSITFILSAIGLPTLILGLGGILVELPVFDKALMRLQYRIRGRV